MTFSVDDIPSSALSERFPPNSFGYLGWLSFETRSLAATKVFRAAGHKAFEYISFRESRSKHGENYEILRKLLRRPKLNTLEVSRSNQVEGLRAFLSLLTKLQSKHNRVLIDLSAFPREYICLAAALDERIGTGTIEFLYNRSFEYSIGQPTQKKWLSIGAGAPESVLTFSGTFIPGRPVAMFALLGFDGDRVTSLVDSIEPEVIAIGTPSTTDPRRDWISERINETARELELRVAKVSRFSFDCDSVQSTMQVLKDKISQYGNTHNICICPSNNKISTFASAQVALENRRVQIAFTPGIIYNEANYAEPSDEFQVISRAS